MAGLVAVGAWLWGTTWFAPLDATTAPLLLVLPLYVWPITLGALVAGVLVATLDLAVGALPTAGGDPPSLHSPGVSARLVVGTRST